MDYTKLTDSEIDRLVAERVMGFELCPFDSNSYQYYRTVLGATELRFWKVDRYHPTTDLNQAFEAVENSLQYIRLGFCPLRDTDKWQLHCNIERPVHTNNPARTICIALLEASEII